MKKVLLALLFIGVTYGQQCKSVFQLTTVSNSVQFDNRQQGCVYWSVAYQVTGFSALSLEFQSSEGATTPTGFGTYAGTTVTGSNPQTTVTGDTATFVGIAPAYVRVDLSGLTGSGAVTGVIVGYTTDPSQVTAVVTLPNPLPVEDTGVAATPADAVPNANIPMENTDLGPIYYRMLPYVFNNTGTQWERLRGDVNGMWINGIVPSGTIIPAGVNPLQLGMASASARARNVFAIDAIADTGSASNLLAISPALYGGGTGTPRWRAASLANYVPATTLTGRNSTGAALVAKDSRWSVNSAPAVSTVASASITSEASVRHVVDKVCFAATSGGAVTAATGTIVIRDGATGAGTILATFAVAMPTAAAAGVQLIAPFCVAELNLVGTTATAMTAEFNALVTNVNQSIFITGFNVN